MRMYWEEFAMAGQGRRIEPYLKIPEHILKLDGLGLSEKVLLAHIYSFGTKGCWQSNATLGRILQASERTISRWLAALIGAGLLHVKNRNGYYRTMWARSHPQVRAIATWYREHAGPAANAGPVRQDGRGRVAASGEGTSPDMANYYNRNNAPADGRCRNRSEDSHHET